MPKSDNNYGWNCQNSPHPQHKFLSTQTTILNAFQCLNVCEWKNTQICYKHITGYNKKKKQEQTTKFDGQQ